MIDHKALRLASALALAGEGFRIVAMLEGHKEPLGREWQKLANDDPDSIRQMLNPTGRQYGVYPPPGSGLFVIDFDVPDVYERLRPLLPAGACTVKTAKGCHVYLRLPEGVTEADVPRAFAGGEVRVGGSGQVVGPWGIHPLGAVYTPQNGLGVATASPELIDALRGSRDDVKRERRAATGPGDDGWTVSEPGRHVLLLDRGRNLRGLGVSGDELRATLHRLNRERCNPPKPADEVEGICDWIEANIHDDPPDPVLLIRAGDRRIGSQTAADLRHGDPPPQLVGEMLTPEDATVLYGPGGTGKGITACWLMLRLVRSDHVVMVIDYEGHEREWGSRLRGLGATDEELGRIHYRAPFGSEWTAATGSLAAVADAIRSDANRLGVTYIVIDSYSVATSSGDTLGGQEAAREYFTGLARIGLPSLTLAHVRGGAERWPDRPFGSVFVHNLSRETWAVEAINAPADDEAEPRIGPHVVELEYRNRKPSGRPLAPPQFLTFEFYPDNSIEAKEGRLAGPTVADLATEVLRDPMTLRQIAAAIKEDTGARYSEDTILKTLRRHPDRFEVGKDKRPAKWSRRL